MFIRNIEVAPISFNPRTLPGAASGFHLTAICSDSISDGMWDHISHPAIFRDQSRAQAFAAKVRASKVRASKVSLRNWVGSSSPCAAFQSGDESPALFCVL